MNTIISCYPEPMHINYMKCSNALYTGRDIVELPLSSGTWTISPCFSLQYTEQVYTCRIQGFCDGEAFTVLLTDYNILLPHDASLDKSVIKSMPQNLITTALKILSESVIDELSRRIGKQCVISDIHISDKSYRCKDGFYFILNNAEHTLHAFLEFLPSSSTIQSLCTWWHQEKAQSRDVNSIHIACTPILDAFALTAKELSSLQIHDCIIGRLASSSLYDGLQIQCKLDDTTFFHGTLCQTKLTIQGSTMHSDEILQNTTQDYESTAPLSIDDLSLKVAFALGTVDMTVGKIAAIQAGEVFITDCDTSAPITVLVNGQAIGKGKLVDVAGRIGIQIVELKAR
ncbi:MAG: FliM/FliN family flagellar motor switch protein [Pseudomonadota bacterium]